MMFLDQQLRCLHKLSKNQIISNFFLLLNISTLSGKSSAEPQFNQSSEMGKKVDPCKERLASEAGRKYRVLNPKKCSDYSISEKSYVKFFQFLKQLHDPERQVRCKQSQFQTSLSDISSSVMNFFNYEKLYTIKQLECSIICLANLFNVLGNDITRLNFEQQFVNKIQKLLVGLAQKPDQQGNQQKIQAVLYILVILIYKERVGEQRNIREINRAIFGDKLLVNSLLDLRLPLQKKISKFYGIVIIYLTNKSINNRLKKQIVRSIILNFGNIDHETTLLNLLVFLRSEKNKVSLNLKDINEGNIFQLLIRAYPRHIHEYQSFYILDYLHYLIHLFPSLALTVTKSHFLTYLLQNTGLINLHHPLHESTIIEFVEKTFKYLDPSAQQSLLDEIVKIQPSNHYIAIKIAQLLMNFEENAQSLLSFVLKGYFGRLLKVISDEIEEGIKKRAVQLYLSVVEKTRAFNQTIAQFLLFKIRQTVSHLRDESKGSILGLVNLAAQRFQQ